MKILFYTDTPNFGGAEKQMEMLARHLNLIGCSVDLACGAYSELHRRKDSLKDVYGKIFSIPSFHKHDPRQYFGLKRILKNGGYDLVHIHLWNPGSCRYAFFAASASKTPIVTTEHDPFPLHGLKASIKRVCMCKTHSIIAISMDNFRQLSEYGEDVQKKLTRVSNGIELDRYLDNKDKASLNVQQESVVITCIAELHERKGIKYLIEAFKSLKTDFPMLHLFLVGKGPDEQHLKSAYHDVTNLHFLGWRDDAPQILRASDLLVLPSLREAFGLVLLEAMASGVAVIATDNGGTTDIIENGKSGLLVPPANSDRLATAIKTLLLNPGQKTDMEKEALERVKSLFTADIMAKRTLEVYEELLKVW